MSIKFDDRELQQNIAKLYRHFTNIEPFVHLIAAHVKRAIDMNLAARGRWDGKGTNIFAGGESRWKDLASSTKERYKRKGYELNPTLRRTGRLLKSIQVWADKDSINISANMPYAAIHQFGGIINHPGGTAYLNIKGRSVFLSHNKVNDMIKRLLSKKKNAHLKYKQKPLAVNYTKPHKITIPARPFITLTDEDIKTMILALARYLSS